MTGLRRIIPLVGWVLTLVLSIVLLQQLASGPLAAPPLTDPGAWGSWAADREAVDIAFAIGRLLVLAAAWYLLGVTTIGALARALQWSRLITATDLLATPWVRHLLQGALGLGLATAAVTTVTAPVRTPAVEPQAQPVASAQVATEVARAQPARFGADAPDTVATMRVGDAGGVSYSAQVPIEAERPAPPITPPAQALAPAETPAASDAVEWTVAPGEHFWTAAEQILTESWQRAPTDDEVTPYWETLIEANRDRLADPGNPDLVLPGQVMRVPTPPPPGG